MRIDTNQMMGTYETHANYCYRVLQRAVQ